MCNIFNFFLYGLAMWSISFTMTDSPLSGRGQGHVRVIHFGLRKFRYSKSSVYRCYQRSCRRSACGLHLRRSSALWLNARVYYTLVDSNLLIPLGPTSICSGLVVQVVPTLLCSSWRDFDCDVASRGPSAVAELPVSGWRWMLWVPVGVLTLLVVR